MAFKKDTKVKNNFTKITIGLASPEEILENSYGEVTKPETINYRTYKPERDGLFCERIFGPTKDYECACGKYKRIRYKGIVCDRCGVEVTEKKVRRERSGHIELVVPVAHIWYFRSLPNKIGYLLGMPTKKLDAVIYYEKYVVIQPGILEGKTDADGLELNGSHKLDLLSEDEYMALLDQYDPNGDNELLDDTDPNKFIAKMGAEAIYQLLQNVDLDSLSYELRDRANNDSSQQRKTEALKRLQVVEGFRASKGINKPEWMIMKIIPVTPPELRPLVPLDGGRFATSDLNDLYRRVIIRNNRLKRLVEIKAPEVILRNEKRMLQEAVDSLFDNSRKSSAVKSESNRPLKSLSDSLKGKQGRFRQNLLGKRVDYSARSVIVVGPELKMGECGLPKLMAAELYKPFIIRKLIERGIVKTVKSAKKIVDRREPVIWDILENVMKGHPVMLNRAPTLHRLGIQAFQPKMIEGKAIQLHPLACTAFNADFDGDQMAVHLPLSVEAQSECRFLLLSPNNLLKPSDGGPVAVPSQDMVLGIYYLTMERYASISDEEAEKVEIKKEYLAEDEQGNLEQLSKDCYAGELDADDYIRICVVAKKTKAETFYKNIVGTVRNFMKPKFSSENLAMLAYENKEITLHQKIEVVRTVTTPDGVEHTGFVECTLGRLIFNEIIPQDLGFVDRTNLDNILEPEINFHVDKKQLKKILDKCINTHGVTKSAEVLDDIKAMGYKYSTRGAISVSISDMTVPAAKKTILEDAQEIVDKENFLYGRGYLTDEERYRGVVRTWEVADDKLTKALLDGLDKYNNIYMMADSGARGSDKQIKQLAGMRGLMADTSGRTIELPIKSNFREGLDVLEYFISAHGARKGLSDTALRTADSGYLTRRLVDVSQDLIIRDVDCSADRDEKPGMYVEVFMEGDRVVESLKDRITGRYAAESIFDKDGNMLVKVNHMITPKRAENVLKNGVDKDGVPFTLEGESEPRRDAKIKIRTILTCRSHLGVCSKCYGSNMATGQAVQVGEAVGIIAAQSIGEPGTQLTMRTFHTGGVAGGDITQGLPRVEELFEARKPKGLAIITEFGGVVEIRETKRKREVVITNQETGEAKAYLIPYGSRLKVQDGQVLEAGDELTEGSVNPHDILKIKGVRAVQDYMIREVQRVYRLQGVEINDKHIEVIVRQMLKKIRIEESGDSEYLPGINVDALEFAEMNEKLEAEGKEPAKGTQIMLGITKASLATNSFLSAASFQETTKVLTDAAIKGKVDPLIGLKENVLIGKLIPAGTGMKRYRSVKLDTGDGNIDMSEVLEENSDENFDATEETVPAGASDSEE